VGGEGGAISAGVGGKGKNGGWALRRPLFINQSVIKHHLFSLSDNLDFGEGREVEE
jgi:hypothetical protein